jgi:hypothetical protein
VANDDFEDVNSKFRRHMAEVVGRIDQNVRYVINLVEELRDRIDEDEATQEKIDDLTAQLIESNKLLDEAKK